MKNEQVAQEFRQRVKHARAAYPIYKGKLPTDHEHSFTVLRSMGPRLAKLVEANGDVQSYDSAARFRLSPVDVNDLDALYALLEILQQRPDCCIVHGAIIAGTNRECARRLMRDDLNGDKATLSDVARRLLPIDLDGVPYPVSLDPHDLQAVTRYLRSLLPEPFHGVACIGAATSSHLFKTGLCFRLFFITERALTGIEKRRWLRDWRKLTIDVSIYACNQVIYTAAPNFENNDDDPLPHGRLVRLDGARFVRPPSADALKPPERRTFTTPRPLMTSAHAHRELQRCVAEIETKTKGDRHPTIMRLVGELALDIVYGRLDEGIAREQIVAAAVKVGKDARKVNEDIDWVLARERAQCPPPSIQTCTPEQFQEMLADGEIDMEAGK